MGEVIHSHFQPLYDFRQHNNLIELLLLKSQEHADNGKTTCMTDALTEESFDYGEFEEKTRRIGSALCKRGLRKGDVVIYMQIGIIKQPLLLGGVWRANGICRASYPEDDEETLLSRVKESRTGWIYCEPTHVTMCLAVAEKIYWDVEVIVTSEEPVEGCTSIYELMEDDGDSLPELDLTLDDTALIMCTSGTTGVSKGALLSHRAMMWMATRMAKMPLNPDKPNLMLTKGTHISGAILPMAVIISGISTLFLTFISKQRIFDAVGKYQPGFIFGFPTFMLMLANDPEAKSLDMSNLEVIGTAGAPATPAVVNALMSLPGMKWTLNIYGLTECAPLITSCNFDEGGELEGCPIGSLGRLVPETSAKFINVETGEVVGTGEVGELYVKCDGLFTGYYFRPDASKEAFDDDGYFKTGDVGYYDANEFIFLVDRAKEIFKYFNNHVSPTEIENVINSHPEISEVCVIGIPDPDGGGQIPRAVCVPRANSEISPNEIQEYANSKLAGYKHLRGGVFFVDKLPTGKTGKVTRQLVEQLKLD